MTVTIPDLVQIAATTFGTGPVGLGAAVSGFRGIEALTDGATYHYSIGQTGDYEYGAGIYDATTDTLTRDVFGSSNGGDPLALRSGATVSFVALAADIAAGGGGSVGPNLQAIDAQTTSADTVSFWTGDATAALAALTAFGRSAIATTSAAAMRTLLGLGTMATQAASTFVTAVNGVLTGTTKAEKLALSPDGSATSGPYEGIWDSRFLITGTTDSDGIKATRFSNDRKAVLWLVGKSRATSNTMTSPFPPAQGGDDIFNFAVLGNSDVNWCHVGLMKWRICANSKVTGDPNFAAEVPGAFEITTCTGNFGPAFPANNRIGLRVDMFQQVFIPGPRSFPPSLGDYPSVDPVTTFTNGGNLVIGIGGAEIGGAALKFLLASAVLTAVPEPGAFEVSAEGRLYWTNAAGKRGRAIVRADYTVAQLAGLTPVAGDTAWVTDALTPVWGVAVAAGGARRVPVFYDGLWIVG